MRSNSPHPEMIHRDAEMLTALHAAATCGKRLLIAVESGDRREIANATATARDAYNRLEKARP